MTIHNYSELPVFSKSVEDGDMNHSKHSFDDALEVSTISKQETFQRDKYEPDIKGSYEGTRKAIEKQEGNARKREFHRLLARNCAIGAFFGLGVVAYIFMG